MVSLSDLILANSRLNDSGIKVLGDTELTIDPDTSTFNLYLASPISCSLCSKTKEWSTLLLGISSKDDSIKE